MFKHNSFTRDTNWQHLERSALCAAASVLYQPQLQMRQVWIDELNTHVAAFRIRLEEQNLHAAEYHGAVTALYEKLGVLYEYIASARMMIKTIIDDPALSDGNRRMLRDIFDIQEVLYRRSYLRLNKAARNIFTGQDKLISIGATWKLPDAVIANIQSALSDARAASDIVLAERGEKLKSSKEVNVMRRKGEGLLRNVFHWIIAVWGANDDRLLEFGFVPKSQIWTPAGSELQPPTGFIYDANSFKLKWNAVDGAKNYRIEQKLKSDVHYKLVGTTENIEWRLFMPFIGENSFRVCAVNGEEVGDYSAPVDVNITYLGEISNFTWNASDYFLRWDEVVGATAYLLLANDEPFGDIFHTNAVYLAPDPERDLKMQVWATNGVAATPRSGVVIVPKLV